jgi:hypothetical protein
MMEVSREFENWKQLKLPYLMEQYIKENEEDFEEWAYRKYTEEARG